MAKLVLIGKAACVRLTSDEDEENGIYLATCTQHGHPVEGGRVLWGNPCGWTDRYDNLNDAAEYAADHADGVNGQGWG